MSIKELEHLVSQLEKSKKNINKKYGSGLRNFEGIEAGILTGFDGLEGGKMSLKKCVKCKKYNKGCKCEGGFLGALALASSIGIPMLIKLIQGKGAVPRTTAGDRASAGGVLLPPTILRASGLDVPIQVKAGKGGVIVPNSIAHAGKAVSGKPKPKSKKGSGQNPWLTHLRKVYDANSHMSYKQAMIEAKQSY